MVSIVLHVTSYSQGFTKSSFSYTLFLVAQRCIVLDIEGTTTPITFVTDVLFPYARENVGKHLNLTYDTAETQEDIKLLRSQVMTNFLYCFIISCHKQVTKVHFWCMLQVEEDLRQGVTGAVPVPHADEGKDEVIAAMVSNVEAMIKADRKITALKELQVRKQKTRLCFVLLILIISDMSFCIAGSHMANRFPM